MKEASEEERDTNVLRCLLQGQESGPARACCEGIRVLYNIPYFIELVSDDHHAAL